MVVLNPGDESWGNDGFRSWPRYRPYPCAIGGMVKHLRTDFNRFDQIPLVSTTTLCICLFFSAWQAWYLASDIHS